MITEVKVPQLDINEMSVTFIEWCVENKQLIKKGEVVCILETTKSTYEIRSENSGYIFINKNIESGEKIENQAVIAVISDLKDFVPNFPGFPKCHNKDKSKEDIRATQKALKLIEEFGIDIYEIWSGEIIKEKDVLAYIEKSKEFPIKPIEDNNLIIVGAGTGGKLIAQVLLENYSYNILGFLDSYLYKKVDSICGYKILGNIEDLSKVYQENPFSKIVCSISIDMNFRYFFFEKYKNYFHFINVIHSKTFVEKTVKVGRGNFIGAETYIGHFSVIGNNCWIASGCIIEHDNHIGDSCLLGPSVSTSGCVEIGDRTIIGTKCSFIPNVKVGKKSVINSGIIVTSSLEECTKLKIKK